MKRDAILIGACVALLCSTVPSSSYDPLESDVRSLEERVRNLDEKISRAQDTAQRTRDEISDLKSKSRDSRSDSDLRDIREEISRLKSREQSSRNDDGELRGLKDEVSRLKDLVRHQDERIAALDRHRTTLGWAERHTPNFNNHGVANTVCGSGEAVTEINWQDHSLRCAPLTDQRD